VTSRGNNTIDLVYSDGLVGNVYYRFYNGSSWSGDTYMNFVTNAAPAISTFCAGCLVAGARNAYDNNIFLVGFGCGGPCTNSWFSIGAPPGGALSGPSIAPFGTSGSYAVFVQGADHAMWVRIYNALTGWGGWGSAGGGLGMNGDGSGSAPAAVWVGPQSGVIQVFVRGGNNHLYQNTLSCAIGCGFSGYYDLTATIPDNGYWDGSPSAVANGSGWIQLFSADRNRLIWEHVYVPGIGWYPISIIVGGLASADPTATSSSFATVQLFTSRGASNDMSEYIFDPRP
jgi:hypothetical protein